MGQEPSSANPVTNFGGTVTFTPRRLYAPTTEAEVLDVLDRHARGKVRVVGARHSWNDGIVTDDALIDLRHFDSVAVAADGTATVGGGCRIKHALRKLHALGDYTLPAIGLITEQTVAGTVSTATHGSGRPSFSGVVTGLRVAAYDPDTGAARVFDWAEGDPELRAARCAVGCMGVVLAVRFQCVPRYDVAQTAVACGTIDEVLAGEERHPLQQFYLIPHKWTYAVHRRAVTSALAPRTWAARLHHAWWFLGIDVGYHLALKGLVSWLRRRYLIRAFYRRVLLRLVVFDRTVVDRGEIILVMAHELFRHVEIELYVPARHVRAAAVFVRTVLAVFDGTSGMLPYQLGLELDRIGMREDLLRHRGSYCVHFPVTFRKVPAEDGLISPTSGGGPWYAVSVITYARPVEPFLAVASYLARAMAKLYGARPHWGKTFPLGAAEVDALYPGLPAFREHCRRVDPHGVFRNAFAERVLFGAS